MNEDLSDFNDEDLIKWNRMNCKIDKTFEDAVNA